MPELTTKEWIEHSTPDMLTKDPPDDVQTCWQDPDWVGLFRLYAVKVGYAGDSVGFLDAVDRFDKQPTLASAQEIYKKFVREDSPTQVNLPFQRRTRLERWFEADTFANAYQEITGDDAQFRKDFRDAVDQLKARDAQLSAREIYDLYVCDGAPAPINLSDQTRTPLIQLFDQSHPAPHEAGFFEEAYKEIMAMLRPDTYQRFRKTAMDIRPQLKDAALRPGNEAIGRPGKVAMPQGRPDQAAVDNWNEKALKALSQGLATDFYQVEEVVIVANPAAGTPPGISWAQQQQGVAVGKITMTKKGGAFDPGSIKAEGVGDAKGFRAAISRVSKKRVEEA